MARDAGELAAPQVVAKRSKPAGLAVRIASAFARLSIGGQVVAVLSVMTLREARVVSFGQVL